MENELAARLGRSAENDSKPDSSAPDVYVSDDFKRREEKEANAAWISGIAEVPLSVEERIRNVEATELAKKKMLAEAGLAMCAGSLKGAWTHAHFSHHILTLPCQSPCRPGKDEEEDFGGSKGLRRGLYPPSFGKQDSAAKERIKNAQYVRGGEARGNNYVAATSASSHPYLRREANARARAHHAAQRAKKRAEDHPNW